MKQKQIDQKDHQPLWDHIHPGSDDPGASTQPDWQCVRRYAEIVIF